MIAKMSERGYLGFPDGISIMCSCGYVHTGWHDERSSQIIHSTLTAINNGHNLHSVSDCEASFFEPE